MLPDKNINERVTVLWEKYRAFILSVILTVYGLPATCYIPSDTLDGAWQRAINVAIKNHLVFGVDFIFTYGPLGFLVTRNTQYISSALLVLGDMFLSAGLFYIIFKYIKQYKGWFAMLLFAIFFLRGADYTQSLFVVFILFSLFNIDRHTGNYFELGYSAVAGVLLFFIKVNYGLIALAVLLFIAVSVGVKSRKAFLFLISIAAITFCLIYFSFHIDLISYIKNSLEIIKGYDESVLLEIQPLKLPFISAVILIALFLAVVFVYISQGVKQKNYKHKIIPVVLFALVCFLMYRNAFTRSDTWHHLYFFSVFPLFIIFVLFYCGYGKLSIAGGIASLVIFLCCINLVFPQIEDKKPALVYDLSYALPSSYFKNLFTVQADAITYRQQLPADKLKLIGNATIDVIPIQIELLVKNGLNYDPRPVPQSYSAYTPKLDALNADHFYKPNRPELLLIRTDAIDGRYAAWDESLMKAVIHLNYHLMDSLAFKKYNLPFLARDANRYLMLKSNGEKQAYPHFEKTGEKIVDMDDLVDINFPDSEAIYMTAAIEYNLAGKLEKIFYQPPPLRIALFPEFSAPQDYTLARPVISGPVLINKLISGNAELGNFMTGRLKQNRNIKGFILHADKGGVKQQVKLTFYRFSNY